MVGALTSWLGLVLVVLAVLTTLALEVREERLPGNGGGSRSAVTARSRSRTVGCVLQVAVVLLVVAVLAATAVRLVTLAA